MREKEEFRMQEIIRELNMYYSQKKLPNGVVKLEDWEVVTNISKIVDAHLGIINNDDVSSKIKKPYIDRLLELKEILEVV